MLFFFFYSLQYLCWVIYWLDIISKVSIMMVHLDKYELPSDYQQNEQKNHVVAPKHSISSSRFTFHKVPVSFKM